MAIGECVKPREIVKATNELFRCKYKIKDVVAGRIFMAFASLVDHKDVKDNQSFVEYKISADSILSDTCMGGDNYKQLQDAAYSLVDQKIELRISKNEFYYYTLFSKIGYKDGIIIGEFHKDLMPFFLIAKERFTKMQLSEYMQLPSIYSQCIFSFLKSWSDKSVITVKLLDLHEMLDTPQSFRKDFYEFKRRVLEKSRKDINEKTSLRFEYEAIKFGRSVNEIKFIISRNLKRPKLNNQKAIEFLQATLGDCVPFVDTRQGKYEKFLHKFPNGGSYRNKTWKIWFELYENGNAPLENDVNNENDPVEFLKQWQIKLETNNTSTNNYKK